MHDNNSLVYQCLKARYFPRTHLFDAKESPNCSLVWKSIVVAFPILKYGCYWRVGNGHSVQILRDKWIPNYPTNAHLHLVKDEVREVTVAELINQDLHAWRSEFIMDMFEKKDVEAKCRIQLSRRHMEDIMIWMHQKKRMFTVKSAYKVARDVLRGGRVAESTRGCVGKRIWSALWKLRIPNKIKVFGWRACNDVLPTKLNLSKRRIIDDAMCSISLRFPESVVHALWECDVARDVWVGSLKILQKGGSGMVDMVQLMEYLLVRVESQDMEVVLIQAWLIWNQRNKVVHGGKFHNSGWLNNRAREFLEEFWITSDLMELAQERQPTRDT